MILDNLTSNNRFQNLLLSSLETEILTGQLKPLSRPDIYKNPVACKIKEGEIHFSAEQQNFVDYLNKSIRITTSFDQLQILFKFYTDTKKEISILASVYRELTFKQFMARLAFARYKCILMNGLAIVPRDDAPLFPILSNKGDKNPDAEEGLASSIEFFLSILGNKTILSQYLSPLETMLSSQITIRFLSTFIGTGNRIADKDWNVVDELIRAPNNVGSIHYCAPMESRRGQSVSPDHLCTALTKNKMTWPEPLSASNNPKLEAKEWFTKFQRHEVKEIRDKKNYPPSYKGPELNYKELSDLDGITYELYPNVAHADNIMFNSPALNAAHAIYGKLSFELELNQNNFSFDRHEREPISIEGYLNRTRAMLRTELTHADKFMRLHGLGDIYFLRGLGLGAFSIEFQPERIETLFLEALKSVLKEIKFEYIREIVLVNFPSSFNAKRFHHIINCSELSDQLPIFRTNIEAMETCEIINGFTGAISGGDSASMVFNEANMGSNKRGSDPADAYSVAYPEIANPQKNPHFNQDCMTVQVNTDYGYVDVNINAIEIGEHDFKIPKHALQKAIQQELTVNPLTPFDTLRQCLNLPNNIAIKLDRENGLYFEWLNSEKQLVNWTELQNTLRFHISQENKPAYARYPLNTELLGKENSIRLYLNHDQTFRILYNNGTFGLSFLNENVTEDLKYKAKSLNDQIRYFNLIKYWQLIFHLDRTYQSNLQRVCHVHFGKNNKNTYQELCQYFFSKNKDEASSLRNNLQTLDGIYCLEFSSDIEEAIKEQIRNQPFTVENTEVRNICNIIEAICLQKLCVEKFNIKLSVYIDKPLSEKRELSDVEIDTYIEKIKTGEIDLEFIRKNIKHDFVISWASNVNKTPQCAPQPKPFMNENKNIKI